jgi:hypothetical protein
MFVLCRQYDDDFHFVKPFSGRHFFFGLRLIFFQENEVSVKIIFYQYLNVYRHYQVDEK